MQRRFMSIRFKFMGAYLLILFAVLILIAGVLPSVMSQYFIELKTKNLQKTQEIIQSTLEGPNDFRTDESAQSKLETAAQAMDINIWICTDTNVTNNIRVYSYGSENSPQIANTELQPQSLQLIQDVILNKGMRPTQNAFPEIFTGNTLSIGYSQKYLSRVNVMTSDGSILSYSDTKQAAVFLHISMDDISTPVSGMYRIVLLAMLALTIVASLVIGVMSNNIIYPVNQMKNAAKAITNGDFSKEVNISTNDEIGDLAQSFNKMAHELQEVDKLRSDFIANISHDFRSPLTSIKGFLEAMLDGTVPQEDYAKYMQIVLDETNRLTKMTNNILDLTKMENGQEELHRSNFDINEMIVKLAIGFEQRIEDKKLKMDFQFLQEKLYVNADLDKIQRVVYNLIDNAIKFTDEGDSITIETSIVGKKAYIAVEDTGRGIDEESLPHVFERFHKADKSRGYDKKGTGLGLAIVKQIMLNHQEDIQVTSKEGQGTKFTFTLPLAYKINLVEKK